MLNYINPKNSIEIKLFVSQLLLSVLLFILDPEIWVTVIISIYTILDELFF